jgi:hypothetical protein
VLDLGLLRIDRVDSKSVADMAAAAAVVDYDASREGAAEEACEDAVAFAAANLGDASIAELGRSCEEIYATYTCDPLVSPDPPATYRVGEHTVEIFIPVVDGHPLMEDLDHGDFDADPCDRVGVRVQQDRDFLLAGVAGFGGATTAQGAVGRAAAGEDLEEFVSLVVLRRTGSQTLYTFGGAEGIVVEKFVREDGKVFPGTISVDTLPQGGAPIDRRGASDILVPDGEHLAFGLTTFPYNQVVNESGGGTLDPEPKAGRLITRAPIDHRYNCQDAYAAGEPYDPIPDQIPIDPCVGDDTPSSSYIAALHTEVEDVASAVALGATPTGWTVEDDCSGSYAGSAGAARLYLDCSVTDELELSNFEHVIINGGINLNGDELRIVNTPDEATVLVIRNGDIRFRGGGSGIILRNVFTYHVNGRWNLAGDPDRLLMEAPLDPDDAFGDDECGASELPVGQCFAPLAYWANTTSEHRIRGGATGGIIGTVFTPNATVDINPDQASPGACEGTVTWDDLGAEPEGSLNLRGSQIFAEAFQMGGGAKLHLCPSPDTTVGIPFRLVGLIR